MIARLARRALAGFISWRNRKRLARAVPDLVARRDEIEALRRRHRPTRRLLRAQRDAMTARLASELSTTLPDRRFS